MILLMNAELNDEVTTALANLKKLDRPDPPYVEVLGSRTVKAIWNRVSSISGFEVTYKLACGKNNIFNVSLLCGVRGSESGRKAISTKFRRKPSSFN